MKRTIVVLALVTAFVFAFSAVAQGTFRGWSPIRNAAERADGMLNHFITFPEARAEMARNGAPAELQNSAHGGYVTTTTKCAVCHSAHRGAANMTARTVDVPGAWVGTPAAPPTTTLAAAREGDSSGSTTGAINLANARNQYFLTAGPATCETCHVSAGGQASRLLVEWGGPVPGYTGGGPHGSPARGCTMCHNAGIHGLSGSQFNVMNTFMLGSTRGFVRGVAPTVAESRDQQIIREINDGRILRGGVLDITPAMTATGGIFEDRREGLRTPAGSTGSSCTWWIDGDRGLGPIGTTPPALRAPGTAVQLADPARGGTQYGAARSLATAYTCGEAGCHSATAMFNLNWGLGVQRVDFTRNGVVNGFQTTGMTAGAERVEVTGHVMPSVRVAGGANQACGPCHAGNPAGFPTASTVAGARDTSRLAFGCDQCHDMVGVATNSTAWPHGNRNIMVYEWDTDGVQRNTWLTTGSQAPEAADHVINGSANLWMYAGSIARCADGALNTNNASQPTTATAFGGTNSINPSFADQSWTVITGAGSGRYGLDTSGTGLVDGSCLKCHVALDSASMAAGNHLGADALRHAWLQGVNSAGNIVVGANNANPYGATNPAWNGTLVTGAQRLFLYR